MSDEQVRNLVEFGLTALQARVYLVLLQLGACRASKVSSTVGIARPEAYRILRELSLKAIVQQNATSPTTYTATAPDRALPLLHDRFAQRVVELDKKKSTIIRSIASYAPTTGITPPERFSVITGGANLIQRMKQMILEAEREYVGIMSRFGLKDSKQTGLASALFAAKRRGVNVRLIADVDDSNVKRADDVCRRLELRTSKGILFYMGIIDKSQMFIGPAFTNAEISDINVREVDLWTNSARFINGMHALFESLWVASSKYVTQR